MTELGRLAAFFDSWEGRIEAPPHGVFDRESSVSIFPRGVAECFTGIDAERLEDFSYGCRLFSIAIVKCDDVMDYVTTLPRQVKATVPQLIGVLGEAYRIYGSLFSADRPFWNHMHRYLCEFIDAMRVEIQRGGAHSDWSDFSENDCIDLARGKLGLVRIVAAGVCDFADDFTNLAAFEDVLVRSFLAYQMLDDLHDWREDVRDGNISLLLRSCFTAAPTIEQTDVAAKRIFFGGCADRVLAESERNAELALERIRALGGTLLQTIFERQLEQAALVREKLAQDVRGQLAAAGASDA